MDAKRAELFATRAALRAALMRTYDEEEVLCPIEVEVVSGKDPEQQVSFVAIPGVVIFNPSPIFHKWEPMPDTRQSGRRTEGFSAVPAPGNQDTVAAPIISEAMIAGSSTT